MSVIAICGFVACALLPLCHITLPYMEACKGTVRDCQESPACAREETYIRSKRPTNTIDALQGLEEWEEAVRDCERALNLEKDNGTTKQKLERAQQLLKKSRMKDYYKVRSVWLQGV